MHAVKMAEGPSAEQRLEELGLSVAVIKEALLTGHGRGRQFGDPYPAFVAGSVAWAEIGVRLTELLAPEGWEAKEVQGQMRVWNSERAIMVIPQRGDENTGNPDPATVPAQRNKKGPTTRNAVELNYAASLFDDLEDEDDDTPDAWILLYTFGEESICAELSFPDNFSGGRTSSWAERIIIPATPYGDSGIMDLGMPDDLPDTGFDFDIERRTA